jgi:hypothetical protein
VTESESKKEGDAESSAADGKEKSEEAEDPVKKELEAKNKEIIDLKVASRSTHDIRSILSKILELTFLHYRIDIYGL